MKNGDYITILSQYGQSSVDSIFKQMRHSLGRCNSLNCIERSVNRLIPCVSDGFASLRHISFFMEKLLPNVDFEQTASSDLSIQRESGSEAAEISDEVPQPETGPASEPSSGVFLPDQDMEHAGIRQLKCMLALHKGKDISTLLKRNHSNLEVFITLSAAALLKSPLPLQSIFSVAGRSTYIDSLIRHMVRSDLIEEKFEEKTVELRKLLRACRTSNVLFNLILDIASEHAMLVLDEGEAVDLLRQHQIYLQPTLSLLRYIGERGFRDLLPELHIMLRSNEYTLPAKYAIVDVMAQLGDEREIGVMEAVTKSTFDAAEADKHDPFVEFLKASMSELRRKTENPYSAAVGNTLVQCMFYGDILLPGQAGGGGLTTFLNTLGNNLAVEEQWENIYTFVFVHPDQGGPQRPLFQKAGNFHFVVGIPVSFSSSNFAENFAVHEYEIMRSIRRTLQRYSIDPDLFHLRYSDNASNAVITLAKRLGKKTVFTLTPDPHRNFIDRRGRLLSLSDDTAIRDMNKVFIADRIIENINGIVLIGHHRRNNQVLPYFPQLWLDRSIRRKPLRIMAEGVRISFSNLHGTRTDTYIDLLLRHKGRYRLSSGTLGEALILNVGRLHPLKGQQYLLEAWACSELSNHYCLVFIGGDVENPDPSEAEMLEYIDRCMEKHHHLTGRFCHIPALPNPKVRLLEQSITEYIKASHPNLYVCSSFKEEFGISILEAMVSGFLAIAPQNGGVSSYLEEGKTGFLIDTEDADTIKRELENVLDPAQYPAEKLREIARQGKEMVQETFNIARIAENYSDYYQSLIEV